MRTGSFGMIVILGLALCGIFGVATFVGGSLALSAGAACALIVTLLVAWLFGRSQKRLADGVELLEKGMKLEDKSDSRSASGLEGRITVLVDAMDEQGERFAFYEGLFEGLGNPALACNTDGRIVAVTQSMLEMMKKPIDQVMGKTASQAMYNRDGVSISEKTLREEKDYDLEADLEFWDGRIVPVQLFTKLMRDKDGKVVGVVSSFIDLSTQREQQLRSEEQGQHMSEVGERIRSLAEHVASATELLSASADDQAQGAQKQRAQTTSVATAMEEMTATVIEVAQNATVTSEAADQAHESASEGVSMVDQAVGAINQVAESARQLEKEVSELDAQAEEIGRIISVINDIADQTNLLALNAAIEAARAGDAGRGFAVVADEVRKLAEKTMDATKEVEEAISTIQDRSRHATTSMEQTARQVGQSTDLSNKAGEALQQIMESIKDMVGRVAQIATAAEQQSSAAEEINKSIDDIASIASDADEAAGQAASATRDMADLARELLEVSREFSEGGGEVKLRQSEGEMKGVLPKLAQQFVKERYSEVFDFMQEEMGNPVFLPGDSYPDQVLMQIAEFISENMHISVRDFFLKLGKFTVIKFHEMYPGYFKQETLKEFYMRMNDVHAQLTKDQPGIKPPKFTYEDKGNELFMNYRSARGLFDYFEGILLGAADFKGEKVSVAVKPFDDETARAEIVFLDLK